MKRVFIEGMACQHCAKAVTKALVGLGASDVSVDLANGYATANVSADDSEIRSTIESLDFTVVDIVTV